MADFESLLERLIRRRVEFVVIGGFAATAYGVTLLTEDLDICCPFTPENASRLWNVLSDIHPVHRMTPKRIPLKLDPGDAPDIKNLYLDTDHGQLDCLGNVKEVGDYPAVLEQSVEIGLGKLRFKVLGLDALIRSKEALKRARDKLAVIQLKAIRERTRKKT